MSVTRPRTNWKDLFTRRVAAAREAYLREHPRPVPRRLPLQKIPDWYRGEWWLDGAGNHGCSCGVVSATEGAASIPNLSAR